MSNYIGWILFFSTIAFIVLYRIFSKNPEAFRSKYSEFKSIERKYSSPEKIIAALEAAGFCRVRHYSEENRFLATGKISMSSWGEFIEVKLIKDNAEHIICFKSVCSFLFQVYDWGKNKRNAKRFFKALSEI
jgi:hypothetical protein